MKPSATDSQIFGEMKEVLQSLRFSMTDEGYVVNYPDFLAYCFKDTPSSGSDLSVGYEMKAKTIWIASRIYQTVSPAKQRDFFELFNYINHSLMNARLSIDPATQEINFRGEMVLFGDPLNREHFKVVIVNFLGVVIEFLPMILDFLNGYIKKEDIKNKVDANIESWNGRIRKSEDQLDSVWN